MNPVCVAGMYGYFWSQWSDFCSISSHKIFLKLLVDISRDKNMFSSSLPSFSSSIRNVRCSFLDERIVLFFWNGRSRRRKRRTEPIKDRKRIHFMFLPHLFELCEIEWMTYISGTIENENEHACVVYMSIWSKKKTLFFSTRLIYV